MGITAMIPGTTIDGLLSEAEERWHDIFDAEALRMQVMLICPRKERKILEMHGDMVEHGQPVIGVFHRPRAEVRLLEEQGLQAELRSERAELRESALNLEVRSSNFERSTAADE